MTNVVQFPPTTDTRADAVLATIDTLARVKVQLGPDAAHDTAVGVIAGAVTAVRVARGSAAALRILDQIRAGIVAQYKADDGVRGRR